MGPVPPVREARDPTGGGTIHTTAGSEQVQGVIKSYDPATKDGIVVRDTDLSEFDLGPTALDDTLFRMLRQGQRVRFELDDSGRAIGLNLGSEVDMGTPAFQANAEPAPES